MIPFKCYLDKRAFATFYGAVDFNILPCTAAYKSFVRLVYFSKILKF